MKPLILTFILVIVSLELFSQSFLTIGEVFDFDVGDKLQYIETQTHDPPDIDRITIINKYYSANGDTLFYVCFHDSYKEWIAYNPGPYFVYQFWTLTDTVSYTNLDSSITTYDQHYNQSWIVYDTYYCSYDSLNYISTTLCDTLINGFYITTNSFEPDLIKREFGKGLGLTNNF